MVVEAREAVELLEQVEDDVRLEGLHRLADRQQLVGDAEGLHLVAEAAQRLEHVVLGLPLEGLALAGGVDVGRAA